MNIDTSTQNIILLSNKITSMTYMGNTILKSTFCKNFNFSIGICHSHSDSLVIWRYGSSSAVNWNTQSSKCNTIWSWLIGTTKPKKNSKKASDTACPLVKLHLWSDFLPFFSQMFSYHGCYWLFTEMHRVVNVLKSRDEAEPSIDVKNPINFRR